MNKIRTYKNFENVWIALLLFTIFLLLPFSAGAAKEEKGMMVGDTWEKDGWNLSINAVDVSARPVFIHISLSYQGKNLGDARIENGKSYTYNGKKPDGSETSLFTVKAITFVGTEINAVRLALDWSIPEDNVQIIGVPVESGLKETETSVSTPAAQASPEAPGIQDLVMPAFQSLTSYLSSIYYYLIFSVILGMFFTIIKDRKLFPANSWIMLLVLSVIQIVLGSYLFIRSFGSGSREGSGVVLPDGTFIADPQPILYAIDDILFHLLFPLTLFIVLGTLYLIFTEIPQLKEERRIFDAAAIILAGSLLFIFFLTGLNEIVGYVSFIATMLLLITVRYYKVFLYIILTIVFILLYFGR